MLAMIEQFQEAWEELTAPGAQFATTVIEVRGVPVKVFEIAVADDADRVGTRAGVRRSRLHRLRGRALHLRARPMRSSVPWLPISSTRTASSRATGWRSPCATTPSGCSATGPIVSVGAACVGMNAWWTSEEMEYGLVRLATQGADRRRRAGRAGAARPGRLRAEAPLHLMTVRYDGALPADADRWEDVDRPVDRSGRPADGGDRPRRRRLHLLHVGHDRLPEGRPAHPPRLGAQPAEPGVHGDGAPASPPPRPGWRRAAAGDGRRRVSRSRTCSWRRRRCST